MNRTRGERSIRSLVTVVLECDHQVTAKNPPMHPKAKYVCPARCGYQKAWMQYTNHASEYVYYNPLFSEDSASG